MKLTGPIISLAILSFLAAGLCAQEEKKSIESKYLKNMRQVTSGFEKAGEGYFSPDGKKIIYQAVRGGYPFYQIFTQPLKGGTPRLLSTGRTNLLAYVLQHDILGRLVSGPPYPGAVAHREDKC